MKWKHILVNDNGEHLAVVHEGIPGMAQRFMWETLSKPTARGGTKSLHLSMRRAEAAVREGEDG